MNNTSNNSEFDLIRMQIDCARGTAKELIERGANDKCGDDFRELIAWLQESQENQDRYDQRRELDRLVRDSIVSPFKSGAGDESHQADELDAASFAQRMKIQLASNGHSADSDPGVAGFDSEDADGYHALFEQSDTQEELLSETPKVQQQAVSVADSKIHPDADGKESAVDRKSRRPGLKWWIATAASVMAIALSITIAMMWETPVEEAAQVYTAEMLCNESLDWKPNGPAGSAWNQDIESAPADRLFPAHLVRHQAQSWRRMEIGGDEQAVVYNLVPEGHLSELKAYLYVFKTDRDYQLPSQFGSHPNANRKYKFWSLACQQDLVFVLVYEGDEKRLHELVKRQEVG